MSKAAQTLRNLHQGDIIKMTRTLRYDRHAGLGDHYVYDVAGDPAHVLALSEYDTGSLKIEMVKRVNRRKPQRQDFNVGDVLTGGQIRRVMWKRGTIFRATKTFAGNGVVLRSDGKLYPLTNTHGQADFDGSFTFADLNSSGDFVLEYLP